MDRIIAGLHALCIIEGNFSNPDNLGTEESVHISEAYSCSDLGVVMYTNRMFVQ